MEFFNRIAAEWKRSPAIVIIYAFDILCFIAFSIVLHTSGIASAIWLGIPIFLSGLTIFFFSFRKGDRDSRVRALGLLVLIALGVVEYIIRCFSKSPIILMLSLIISILQCIFNPWFNKKEE